eukprot:5823089-Amphidinium_carterae.1
MEDDIPERFIANWHLLAINSCVAFGACTSWKVCKPHSITATKVRMLVLPGRVNLTSCLGAEKAQGRNNFRQFAGLKCLGVGSCCNGQAAVHCDNFKL